MNTGANTYFGKTAELVKTAKPKSHQEQIMLAIVKYMMYLGIATSILVATYAVVIGTGLISILTFAIIFLMGVVPVALPAVLAIVQSVGAVELSKKGVLVTRLDSIRTGRFHRHTVPGQDGDHYSEPALCWRNNSF